jgi:hypothetical protein
MKEQVSEKENPVGVNSGAGEGAFPPTPSELAQLKEKLEKEVRDELEMIKYRAWATGSVEFSDRIEKAILRVLREHNLDSNIDVEYSFDEYPIAYTRVNVDVDKHRVIWYTEEAVDTVKIINKETKETLLEITIHYEADVLEVKSRHYIKLNKIIDLKIEVRE